MKHSMSWVICLIFFMMYFPLNAQTTEQSSLDLLSKAQSAYRTGHFQQALSLANQAIKKNPSDAQGFLVRGWLYEMNRQHHRAINDYNKVLRLDPFSVDAYNRRGSEYFKLGNIKKSITDFDKAINLDPKKKPYHWQRGISYYYAGRYQEGRDQFQSHQRVNSNDVENAVWHFLCQARLVGLIKARQSILKINSDPRVPMMEIYQLFTGVGTVENVLAAANKNSEKPLVLQRQLFYANLYLGLYFEAIGNSQRAQEHIFLAAKKYPSQHYMGDVARVHAEILKKP